MIRYLSIDAGGTFIKYAWMDASGHILKQGKKPTPYTSQEDFMEVIHEIWKQERDEKAGICMSLPGTIDVEKGYIYQGGSLTYHHGVAIKEKYETFFGVPVELENDARCAALAEMASGHMQDIENGIVLTFGTGVGGCFIMNHDIYKGTHLFSGEVSMLICDDLKAKGMDAVLGHIGGIGHFCRRVCDSMQVPFQEGKTVFQWIQDGNEIAMKLFHEYCYQIAIQLFNIQMMLDPSRICIGGGVSENPIFIQGIQKAMTAFYDSLPVTIPRLDIVPCFYHNDANLIGAYYHFQQQQSKVRD
jgi:predicted NBD/HSP70 family sugar kinase